MPKKKNPEFAAIANLPGPTKVWILSATMALNALVLGYGLRASRPSSPRSQYSASC